MVAAADACYTQGINSPYSHTWWVMLTHTVLVCLMCTDVHAHAYSVCAHGYSTGSLQQTRESARRGWRSGGARRVEECQKPRT